MSNSEPDLYPPGMSHGVSGEIDCLICMRLMDLEKTNKSIHWYYSEPSVFLRDGLRRSGVELLCVKSEKNYISILVLQNLEISQNQSECP